MQTLDLNCGGKGGKPGPCPMHGHLEGVKLPKLQAHKIRVLNPDGPKGGVLKVPKATSDAAIAQLQAKLPPGHKIERVKASHIKLDTPVVPSAPAPSPATKPAGKMPAGMAAILGAAKLSPTVAGFDAKTAKAALTGKADTSSAGAANNAIRSKIVDDIYTNKKEIPDAVLKVMAKHKPATERIAELTQGNVAAAQKEYASTPKCDLDLLTGIKVLSVQVQGQAVCHMGTRELTMGTTSVSGDYRHELGHAVHASYIVTGSKIDAKVKELYAEVKTKILADPTGVKQKLSHEEYEAKYGVVGRRSLDNDKENFAEFYRLYHREVYRDLNEGGGGKNLNQFRQRHPEWARIFDAHYTAALIGDDL